MGGGKRLEVFAANTFLLFEEISYFSSDKGRPTHLPLCLERMLALHFLIKRLGDTDSRVHTNPKVCK